MVVFHIHRLFIVILQSLLHKLVNLVCCLLKAQSGLGMNFQFIICIAIAGL